MEELFVTWGALLFPFVIPTYTAWTHPNWKGAILGALTLWIFLFLAEAFLVGHYGTDGPGGVFLLGWFLTGWIWSLLYCCIIGLIAKRFKKTAEPTHG